MRNLDTSFFEKINKIDTPLARLRKKERTLKVKSKIKEESLQLMLQKFKRTCFLKFLFFLAMLQDM